MRSFLSRLSSVSSPLRTGMITDIKTLIDRYGLYAFYFVIILLRFPPVNLFLVDLNLLNSHSIARYVLVFLFIYFALRKSRAATAEDWIILFFFATQVLSVIGAIDMPGFVLSLKNYLFAIPVYYLAVFLVGTRERIKSVTFLLAATAIGYLGYEALIYFFPDFFYLLRPLFYGPYWENFDVNFMRYRYFVDIFDFSLVPILLYMTSINLWFFPALFLLFFFAAVSGFRSHILSYGLGLIAYFLRYKQSFVKRFLAPSALVVSLFLAYLLFNQHQVSQLTAITRILDDPAEVQATLTGRLELWGRAWEVGSAYPLTGVGLGNFYLYTVKPTRYLQLSNLNARLERITTFNPHNIFFSTFAETGLIGLAGFTLMIFYWFLRDLKFFPRMESLGAAYVLSFWALFSYSVLNPTMTAAQYTVLFWLFRGIIHNIFAIREK